MSDSSPARVYIETLGCARNDVDSSELSGRLAAQGWQLADTASDADVALVNTCGFIEQAKKDSIDTVLELADESADGGPAVVAIGCLAERYGQQLADELPEAAAVLGFDSYQDMSSTLKRVLAGDAPAAHVPADRRTLLPVTPVDRAAAAAPVTQIQRDVNDAPWQPVKLASGCDRRCAFCAIPTFRGSFISRPPEQILAEAQWLADRGVRELFLVSENTSSYGKDLGDIRLLETLIPQLAQVSGVARVRVSYLQPAEIRPGLLEVIAQTPGVAPYFDISFQHASATMLRRMRRFGSLESFLELVARVRQLHAGAGIRSNVIVGFPGETDQEFEELATFVGDAELDVVGVFEYSDEDGTEAAGMPDKVDPDLIRERARIIRSIAETAMSVRAQDRVGDQVSVLIEDVSEGFVGRAEHQGPQVDGVTTVLADRELVVGDLVSAVVVDTDGADLVAQVQQDAN